MDDGNCLSKEFENYGHRLESLDWGLHNIIDIYICILHFIQADDWSGDFSQIQRGIWVGNVGAIMALEYVHVIIGNVCRHSCRKGCGFDKKQAKVKSLLVHVIKHCFVHTCILISFMTCIAVGKKVPR